LQNDPLLRASGGVGVGEENGIDGEGSYDTGSSSFDEGCQSFIDGGSGIISSDSDEEDE
jgi:hypothetical protein